MRRRRTTCRKDKTYYLTQGPAPFHNPNCLNMLQVLLLSTARYPHFPKCMFRCSLFLYQLQRTINRIPHLFSNPLLKILFICRDVFLRCESLFCSLFDDGSRDVDTDLPDVDHVRKQTFAWVLECRALCCECFHSGDQHLVR